MSDPITIVAHALVEARRNNTPADAAPLASLLADAQAAYAVQARVAQELGWFDAGVPRFWKSGGPARDGALTHAPLPPAMVWNSPASARDRHFNMRMIEAEIALRLARDVTPAEAAGLSHEEAPSLVDAMTVSIELCDSRWRDPQQAAPLLKLADQQTHGALALGEWVPFAPRAWDRQRCRVRIGDAPAREFTGTHSLADPAWLLPVWLRHVTREGRAVPKGTVVTTGTWCGMLPAAAGDRVHVAFEGVGETELRC
jgi:2-keto-4-pentenoate hydratase